LSATGPWFSLGTPVSSTYKTDRHEIAEILLKVALNTIPPPHTLQMFYKCQNITFGFYATTKYFVVAI
jgi:hypothetical protein